MSTAVCRKGTVPKFECTWSINLKDDTHVQLIKHISA